MNKTFKSSQGKTALIRIYNKISEESAAELSSKTISTSHGETHIYEHGNPELPVLVLLHGAGSNAASLFYALPELGKKYHVILPDIPGEPGKSEDCRFPCRGAAFTEWITELLNALSLKKVYMGGQSLGAWASLRFAIDKPQSVASLLLVSPSGLASPRSLYLFRLLLSMSRGEKGIRSMISRLHNSSEDEIDETEIEVFKVLMKHCRFREDQPPLLTDDELESVKIPLIYMAGEKDILLNTKKSAARLKSMIPHSKIITYPAGGHALTSWVMDFKDIYKAKKA